MPAHDRRMTHAKPALRRPRLAATRSHYDRATAEAPSGPLFRSREGCMTAKAKRRSKKLRGPVVPQPCGWEDIKVGVIVLASAGARHFEWYEAVVLTIEGESFELRYAEWPDEPVFRRSREQ